MKDYKKDYIYAKREEIDHLKQENIKLKKMTLNDWETWRSEHLGPYDQRNRLSLMGLNNHWIRFKERQLKQFLAQNNGE